MFIGSYSWQLVINLYATVRKLCFLAFFLGTKFFMTGIACGISKECSSLKFYTAI